MAGAVLGDPEGPSDQPRGALNEQQFWIEFYCWTYCNYLEISHTELEPRGAHMGVGGPTLTSGHQARCNEYSAGSCKGEVCAWGNFPNACVSSVTHRRKRGCPQGFSSGARLGTSQAQLVAAALISAIDGPATVCLQEHSGCSNQRGSTGDARKTSSKVSEQILKQPKLKGRNSLALWYENAKPSSILCPSLLAQRTD